MSGAVLVDEIVERCRLIEMLNENKFHRSSRTLTEFGVKDEFLPYKILVSDELGNGELVLHRNRVDCPDERPVHLQVPAL